ncbi:hypothetical protein [Candidatus Caldatribacterium sp.]|uniref:hypothetical protein n=1 Tax=Candidatus Caldatribacterium sp. TaxID=2282143 RepID=UPI00383CA60D|nr:hypothetical protein [Candidatus Caldatribacterium sp.]
MKKPESLEYFPFLSKVAKLYVFPHAYLIERKYVLKANKGGLWLPERVAIYGKRNIDEDTIALNYWWPGFERTIEYAKVVRHQPHLNLPRGWTNENTLCIGLDLDFCHEFINELGFNQGLFISKLFGLRGVFNVQISNWE